MTEALTTDKRRIGAIEDVRALMREEMAAVDRLIQSRLHSDVLLINQLGHYIINSGGKRLRPLLVVLAANACGYRGGNHHHMLAAIVEFIHTATLLHDDVVDASELRRGQQTANAIWGNEASVLVGDFLYSRAFEMMVEVGSMRIMDLMSHTTNAIAEGEVMQLLNCNDPDTTEERYLQVIRAKTARLFEAAARIGAILGGQPLPVEEALGEYGAQLGIAFQLIDDVLDYSADAEQTGKNLGDDLAEGKPTLPLIHAIRAGTPAQRETVRRAIERGGLEDLDAVLEAIDSTGALAYTAEAARRAAGRAIEALAALPESDYKDALCVLAEFAAHRRY
ncbi:MAG: octaprenyl diphosphate synthase [Gammaproteobacteria bacterium]|nr:MAG: octaprenyl diphosphate synthase [Gammaproteobacteria bacterium]